MVYISRKIGSVRRVVCGGCVCLLVIGVGVDVVVGMVVVVMVGH